MSFVSSAILLFVSFILCTSALFPAEYAKSKDLIDVLKHKLRRNNDDYIEPMLTNTTNVEFNQNLTTITFDNKNISTASVKQDNLRPDGKRRSFNKVSDESVEALKATILTDEDVPKDVSNEKTTQLSINKGNVTKKVIKTRTGTLINFRSKNKHMRKDKMDRFKKFVSKNKNAFSEFLKKKQQTVTKIPKTAATPRPISRNLSTINIDTTVRTSRGALEIWRISRDTTERPVTSTEKSESVQETTPFMWDTRKSTQSNDRLSKESPPRMRAQVLRANDDSVNSAIVNPEELDMAPARGRKVHIMRMKNRLCQRNVMLPEGPKYDSKGNMYLGAYKHRHGRDYSRTRKPRLLLPRCCNCCKKSVLGCQ